MLSNIYFFNIQPFFFLETYTNSYYLYFYFLSNINGDGEIRTRNRWLSRL
jgi:hypothetical protein